MKDRIIAKIELVLKRYEKLDLTARRFLILSGKSLRQITIIA
jgi:hypothetical protein